MSELRQSIQNFNAAALPGDLATGAEVSPLPTYMRDRWSNRAEPKILEGFSGFRLTPPRWLHITTLVAGSTAELARDQMSAMVSEAQQRLGDVDPISVTVGKVLYQPEAVMLHVQPVEALQPILGAARAATQTLSVDQHSRPGYSPARHSCDEFSAAPA